MNALNQALLLGSVLESTESTPRGGE